MIEQLIYSSRCRGTQDCEALDKILDQARANNQKLGVTGFLLFDGDTFVQLLEGEARVVSNLFDKISQDPRHRDVQAMIRNTAQSPCFSNWSMAYVIMEAGQLKRFGGSLSRVALRDLIGCLRGGESPVREIIADFLRALPA